MNTTRFTLMSAACLALLVGTVARAATIKTVPVGNAGNASDSQSQGDFGAVDHKYRIGKSEVTNSQYAEFLNGVDPTGANALALYNNSMSSDARGGINFNGGAANGLKYEIKLGRDNNPVTFVSWYDSIRFANWLHNNQAAGDTENGAYTLGTLGAGGIPTSGNSITRNANATWFLPSEDEWYKAAYHKNDGATGNYWDYTTATDAVPFSDQPPGSDAPTQSNTANFRKNDSIANFYDDGYAVTGSNTLVGAQNYLTDVGAYTLSASPYRTFDQGGNVIEWNEARIGNLRGLRGGSWSSPFNGGLGASARGNANPSSEFNTFGFRVGVNVPEPGTLALAGLALVGLAACARRRK